MWYSVSLVPRSIVDGYQALLLVREGPRPGDKVQYSLRCRKNVKLVYSVTFKELFILYCIHTALVENLCTTS
jgi:hypothetical protein